MFNKLRQKIIFITMATTTAVLILAGVFIMLISSATRPEPKPYFEVMSTNLNGNEISMIDFSDNFNSQELNDYIKNDREENDIRLLFTLLSVGIIIEIIVFIITYYFSEKIVAPVKDSYDKQKLFIANASHELKTPLAVIQANMEALNVSKEDKKWKNNIEVEITHANKLVLDLLKLAKMDAGDAVKATPEKVNLATEIRNRITIFQPKFSGKITFKSNTKENTFLLPKQDLLQVIDILLDNATKYGDQKVNILLDSNSLTISNDGATISKKDSTKIFDRFYQTDKTKEGSGLGLAIAKAICDQNGWRLSYDNSNHLTNFSINFAHRS
ncbi:HAMP domain-containing histidine kinase [Candidatus Saccharibacteria bacterium]|nr:HAMP domain-containing histidine kinase [Candidatus Saccharibacteria bacterium]